MIRLTDRENDTVLAALRLWQLWQDDGLTVYSSEKAIMLNQIADEHGKGMTNDEIDKLIEDKINGPDSDA